MDGSEITSFNIAKNLSNLTLKSPDEDYYASTPQNHSPANVYRSDDCNEILAKELEQLDEGKLDDRSPDDYSERAHLVSQSSIEIDICDTDKPDDLNSIPEEPDSIGEVNCCHRKRKKKSRFFFNENSICYCRSGPFWMFISVFRYSTSIAIQEFAKI